MMVLDLQNDCIQNKKSAHEVKNYFADNLKFSKMIH